MMKMTLSTKELEFVKAKIAEFNEMKKEVDKLYNIMQEARDTKEYDEFKKDFNNYHNTANALSAKVERLEKTFCIATNYDTTENEIALDTEKVAIIEIKNDKDNLIRYYQTM